MKILPPITLRDVTFKNRVMFPPFTTGFEAADGCISAQSRAFYTRLHHDIPNRAFIACVLNAENGFELTRSITPATVKKNAVLIGGGPAGREAARVAAQKGHSVTLFEKDTALRAQLNIAQVRPGKIEIRRALQNLEQAVATKGAAIRMKEAVITQSVLADCSEVADIAHAIKTGYDAANGLRKQPLGFKACSMPFCVSRIQYFIKIGS